MKISTAYKAVMSRGDDIQLDPDEIKGLMAGMERGGPIKVRAGIINPSFLVSVVEDKERKGKFLEDTKYSDPESRQKRSLGMSPLKDIFDNKPQLPSPRS